MFLNLIFEINFLYKYTYMLTIDICLFFNIFVLCMFYACFVIFYIRSHISYKKTLVNGSEILKWLGKKKLFFFGKLGNFEKGRLVLQIKDFLTIIPLRKQNKQLFDLC